MSTEIKFFDGTQLEVDAPYSTIKRLMTDRNPDVELRVGGKKVTLAKSLISGYGEEGTLSGKKTAKKVAPKKEVVDPNAPVPGQVEIPATQPVQVAPVTQPAPVTADPIESFGPSIPQPVAPVVNEPQMTVPQPPGVPQMPPMVQAPMPSMPMIPGAPLPTV